MIAAKRVETRLNMGDPTFLKYVGNIEGNGCKAISVSWKGMFGGDATPTGLAYEVEVTEWDGSKTMYFVPKAATIVTVA